MDFSVRRHMLPAWVIPLLALGLVLSFYAGIENSVVFYERLPKEPPEDGFLIFYQPSCPHCIAEIPTIRELVKRGYRVSAVNVFEARELARRYGVRVTPTIVILPQGTVLEGETLEELIEAKRGNIGKLLGQGGSCSVEVKSCSE